MNAPGIAVTAWNERLARWLAPADRLFEMLYGSRYHPLYQTGSLAVGLLLLSLATGLYLLIFYKIGEPHQSVQAIQDQVWAGRWIRALHRYSADLTMAAAGLHMTRMFLQGRTWGPRALAWLSGLLLLSILLLCGWTGLVLVWDRQGQAIAMEGARLLDLLPIFSEPITRAFTRPDGATSAFFFMNLFAHAALPLGLALFVWIHTMRLARAAFLPPRRLWWSTAAALTAFSVAVPAPLGPRADLMALVSRFQIDGFYAFWLPVSIAAPQWLHLSFWAAAALVLVTVPWWWRPRPQVRAEPSSLDEHRCTGCTQCALDCPYEAIAMVPRSIGLGSELVARVNAALCVSCGICAGSCAPMAVGPPLRNGSSQLREIERFAERTKPGAENVIAISCRSGIDQHPAIATLPGVIVYPVSCAGSIHTSVIEYLVRHGAGGVALLACHERDCVYREGPKWLRARLYEDREAELQPRVDRHRVTLINASFGAAFAAVEQVRAFQAALAAPPTPRAAPSDPAHEPLGAECEPAPLPRSRRG